MTRNDGERRVSYSLWPALTPRESPNCSAAAVSRFSPVVTECREGRKEQDLFGFGCLIVFLTGLRVPAFDDRQHRGPGWCGENH
jgi:hypothetical protein